MTNYEHYKEEIEKFLLEYGHGIFAVEEGEIKSCRETICASCEISISGRCNRKKWLNSEYNSYTIPLSTPVNTKVLVSEDGKNWKRRYFSHFSGNKQAPYVCFNGGLTSWNFEVFVEWKYCKLWEGEEE